MKKILLCAALLLGAALGRADTSTPRMGLVKPTIGSTGWGIKTNADWDLVDARAACLLCTNTFALTTTFNGSVVFNSSVTFNGGGFTSLAVATSPYNSGGYSFNSFSTSGLRFDGTTFYLTSLGAKVIQASTVTVTIPTSDLVVGGNVTGDVGIFPAIQGTSVVIQSTSSNVYATFASTGLSVSGGGDFSGFISSDLGVGVGTSTGMAGFNAANSTGQTLGVFVGDVLSATAAFAGASVLQSTVPVRIITDATLTTAAITANGTQVAIGGNSVVGTYALATSSGIFVNGSGNTSQVQGSLQVGGTMAATTITGSGAGITSISGSNVAGGTFGAVNGSALTALTAANITAAGTLPALNGAALTSLTAANVTGAGALPDSVLSSNVPRLNATPQAFSGSNSFAFVQAGTTTSGGILTVAAAASQANAVYVTNGGVTPSLTVSSNNVVGIQAGSGTQTFSPGGILDNLIVSSGTNSGSAAETTLYSYNVPANTFVSTAAANGARQVIYIFAGGTTANATLERIRIYFGSTVCADSGNQALNGSGWKAECWISQIGTGATQYGTGTFIGGTSLLANTDTSPTETISGTINIKVTGTVQVATTNGVLVRHAYIKKE